MRRSSIIFGLQESPITLVSAIMVVIFITTFLLNTAISQTVDTLWIEEWEGNWVVDWHVDAGTWAVGSPTSGPGNAYNGLNCAATVSDGNYPPNANTRLIRHTSFIVPSADQNPRLRFRHWYSISSGDHATVQIKVGTGDWQTISETYNRTGSGIWTYPSIDLSAFSDSTVQISFYFTSDNNGSTVSSGWYVDDIAIITGPVVFNNPETWETGLGDWYGDRGTWEVGTPTSGPGEAYMGENCAATALNGNYHANVNSRLISPPFTIPSANQNPRLRFWHWYSISSGDNATVQIKVGTGDWQIISETYNRTGSGIWTYPSIDLSAFSDSTVQISFYFTSDNNGSTVSSGWYVDDIAVVTGPVVFNNPETWETGLGDWHGDRGTWEVGTPMSGPGEAFMGENCAATVLNGNYHANVNSRLISPPFTIPSADQNPGLSFWHWYSISSGDAGNVQIKTENGQWETILGPFTNTSSAVWSPIYLDLSSYADSTVQIAFNFTSDNNGSTVHSGWYVDDFAVITGPVIFNNPETWETGLGDWYGDRGTWEVGTPASGPGEAYMGENCAATVLNGNYHPNVNSRLISPPFIIPSANQNPRLRFWHWYSISSGDQATVQIKVGTGDWQTISETYNRTGGGIWTHPSIDLSAFADSTVQIAFNFSSDNNGSTVSSGWYVDDVAVITGPVVYNDPETWETGLGDWYGDRGTWEVGTPTHGPGEAYMGENCVATVLNGNYHANVSSRLISPPYTIPSANQNPRLRFWHWYSISSGDNATVQIKVGTGDWQIISETYNRTGSGIWTYPSIDLSAFSDSTVQISFYFTSDNNGSTVSSGWYVDDIAIITGPVVFNNPETWETGLGDWYGDRGTWEVGTPTYGPDTAYTVQNCAATVLSGNYHANVNSRLISPSFILPSTDQNPALSFWHWYSISSGDAGNVQIKTENGQWETILGPFTNTSGGVWSPIYADLSSYADSTVQIAFYFTSDNNGSTVHSGWYIDEINILPDIVSSNDILINNIPLQFQLSQNYPNPFNPSTTIEFDLPKVANVRIEVYNIGGQKIATLLNTKMSAGSHKVEFNAQNLSSSVYFYSIEAGEFQDVKKMILLR